MEVLRMRLLGKVAIVTGAGRGIGAAIAKRFAKEGAKVVVSDIIDQGAEVAEEIQNAGGDAEFFRIDVSDSNQVQNLINYTVEHFGALHVICNNAGINVPGKIENITEEVWDRTMDVNVKSMYLTTKFGIPELRKSGGGSIINLGSVNSLVAEPMLSAYVASKGAILMLTKAIALDYAKENIRANCICPGWVNTTINDAHANLMGGIENVLNSIDDFQPIGRVIHTEEIANVALFLASDESSAMTGSAVVVDGAMTAK